MNFTEGKLQTEEYSSSPVSASILHPCVHVCVRECKCQHLKRHAQLFGVKRIPDYEKEDECDGTDDKASA
jgi:hypothetical protein